MIFRNITKFGSNFHMLEGVYANISLSTSNKNLRSHALDNENEGKNTM